MVTIAAQLNEELKSQKVEADEETKRLLSNYIDELLDMYGAHVTVTEAAFKTVSAYKDGELPRDVLCGEPDSEQMEGILSDYAQAFDIAYN